MSEVSRKKAIEIWKKYNNDESLFKHALAVEAVMRHYAKLNNEDEEEWGVIGILHDIDYGQFPKEHCIKARELLEKELIPECYIRAIQSHGYGICTDIEPKSKMEKTLFAVDELSGFIIASALVRPSKSLDDLEVKSVKKKWKDLRFAAGVDRTVIEKGAEMLEVTLDDLISQSILAMRPVAESLGLKKL